MKRRITLSRCFEKEIGELIRKRRVFHEDYEALKKKITEYPDLGDVISGTGGVRKVRLKSSSKGARGGFRVCYFEDVANAEIFLIFVYGKNEKEDLSSGEKKVLKEFTDEIKKR
ncbi:MAG: type II toxin-antitoxin system RelE/ParE family toxin [Chlamydiales bacterium]|nr:type II toxin-antitoxin system RelE/ParE family toxin [Chlamydiales bacterium]